MPHFSS